jgi:uncharacterized phage protein (TIGR01671 family)
MRKEKEKRRIAFRAWDILNKVMYLNPFNGKIGGLNDLFANAGDWIYMQYTGQKDKDGIEIFEGDIVIVSNTNKINIVTSKETICSSFEIGEIIYNSEDTCYEVLVRKQKDARYDSKIVYARPLRYRSWEVIGNIYETPELLNKNKDLYTHDLIYGV